MLIYLILILNCIDLINCVRECDDAMKLKRDIDPNFNPEMIDSLMSGLVSIFNYNLNFKFWSDKDYSSIVKITLNLLRATNSIIFHGSKNYQVDSVEINFGESEELADFCIDSSSDLIFILSPKFKSEFNPSTRLVVSIKYSGGVQTEGYGIVETRLGYQTISAIRDDKKMRNRDFFPSLDFISSLATYEITAICPQGYKTISIFLKHENADILVMGGKRDIRLPPAAVTLACIDKKISETAIKTGGNGVIKIYDTIPKEYDYGINNQISAVVESLGVGYLNFKILIVEGKYSAVIPYQGFLIIIRKTREVSRRFSVDSAELSRAILEIIFLYGSANGWVQNSFRRGLIEILQFRQVNNRKSKEEQQKELYQIIKRDKTIKPHCSYVDETEFHGQQWTDHAISVFNSLGETMGKSKFENFLEVVCLYSDSYRTDEDFYKLLDQFNPNIGKYFKLTFAGKQLLHIEVDVRGSPDIHRLKSTRFCFDKETGLSVLTPTQYGPNTIWIGNFVWTTVATTLKTYWDDNHQEKYHILTYQKMTLEQLHALLTNQRTSSWKKYNLLLNAFMEARIHGTKYNIDVLLVIIKKLAEETDQEFSELFIEILISLSVNTKDTPQYSAIMIPFLRTYFKGLPDISPENRIMSNRLYQWLVGLNYHIPYIPAFESKIKPTQTTCDAVKEMILTQGKLKKDHSGILKICCHHHINPSLARLEVQPTSVREETFETHVLHIVCAVNFDSYLEYLKIVANTKINDKLRIAVFSATSLNENFMSSFLDLSPTVYKMIEASYKQENRFEELKEVVCAASKMAMFHVATILYKRLLDLTAYDCLRYILSERASNDIFKSNMELAPELLGRLKLK